MTEVSVEELRTGKKYTTVSKTSKGQFQNVYFFNRDSRKSVLIQSVPLVVKGKPHFSQTATNAVGEHVTTTTSVDQIMESVPQVKTILSQIKTKYNVDASTTTTLVQVKGTTVKEVRIVTTTDNITQTVFTGRINGTDVTIVDVQVVPSVQVKAVVPTRPVF